MYRECVCLCCEKMAFKVQGVGKAASALFSHTLPGFAIDACFSLASVLAGASFCNPSGGICLTFLQEPPPSNYTGWRGGDTFTAIRFSHSY